jgi:hypothetical protein
MASAEGLVESYDVPKLKNALEKLYAGIKQGSEHQRCAGALTMDQTRQVKQSNDQLLAAIEQYEKGELTTVDKEVIEAYKFFKLVCDSFQQKGAFSFDGVILLLEYLELISEFIDAHKSPSIKLEELKIAAKAAKHAAKRP